METTSKSEIVIFQTPDGNTTVNVRLENDTVWLSQDQLSVLFERDKSVISRHINNIFSEGELDRNTTVAKNAIVVQRGFRGEIADEIHLRSIMHMYSVICLITNVAETFLEKCSMIYCLIADESKIRNS